MSFFFCKTFWTFKQGHFYAFFFSLGYLTPKINVLKTKKTRVVLFPFLFVNLTAASREFRYKKKTGNCDDDDDTPRTKKEEKNLLKYFLYGKWIFFSRMCAISNAISVSLCWPGFPPLIISRHAIEFENAFASQARKKKVHFHFGASRDFYVNPWLSLIKASLNTVYTTITLIRNSRVFTAEISAVFSSFV